MMKIVNRRGINSNKVSDFYVYFYFKLYDFQTKYVLKYLFVREKKTKYESKDF